MTHVLVRCEYDDGSGIDPTLVEFAVDREDARQVHAEIHSLVLAEERFQLRVPGEPTSVPFWSETVREIVVRSEERKLRA